MTDRLTLVPAGAGSGKTHHIQTALANLVDAGEVDPGRILAVTFTEAAASEMRARIRGALIEAGRISDAIRLEGAYVGTIHALGQRLLTEHAFAAGRSPSSRLMTDPERNLLIRGALANSSALRPIASDVTRYGYAAKYFGAVQSAEDALRAQVLATIDLLRGFGDRGRERAVLDAALAALDEGYGTPETDGDKLTARLRDACKALLAEFPVSLAGQATNATARNDWARDHRNLIRAVHYNDLVWDWKLWVELGKLRLSKRGAPTPDGYDALGEAVVEAARTLPHHPGPLADARHHLTALVTGAQEVLDVYDAAKRRLGLVDYADMIVEAERLLDRHPDVLDAVLAEIDVVVIDEFQDTNPVQFALLWRLARRAKRALVVGDTKQAIMGFQGADARLANALEKRFPEAVKPLTQNWRSTPEVMDFVNGVGEALFPGRYQTLAPVRDAPATTALEVFDLPATAKLPKAAAFAILAERVATILADGDTVIDKATNTPRPACPADIAVLCFSRDDTARMADALRAAGLPVRTQGEGWFGALATQVARAAVALAADPGDRLAALTLATLGPASLPLAAALTAALDGSIGAHPMIGALTRLAPDIATTPVSSVVPTVIAAAGLRDWAAGLADPALALADLARLDAEAIAFDTLPEEARAAAGFHGTGAQVFLGWLAARDERDFDRHPDPTGWSPPGVEVSTWHAAKGREWPITLVAGLDKDIAARPGTLFADFDGFDDLDDVLDHSGIAWLPDFAAPETQKSFTDAQRPRDEATAARELYVSLTRARDRLILALPAAPSKPQERPKRMIDLLRSLTSLSVRADGAGIEACGQRFAARVTLVPPGAEPARDEATLPTPMALYGAASTDAPPSVPVMRTPWRQSPSSLIGTEARVHGTLHHSAPGTPVPTTEDFDSATSRGSAWHLAFRVLAERPELADRLPSATGLAPATLVAVANQVAGVRAWLAAYGFDRLSFEVPFQLARPNGSAINAMIDCLAEGPEGLAILDHKSGPCPYPEARFAVYLPQLEGYARVLAEARPDKPVRLLAINWMTEGRLSAQILLPNKMGRQPGAN